MNPLNSMGSATKTAITYGSQAKTMVQTAMVEEAVNKNSDNSADNEAYKLSLGSQEDSLKTYSKTAKTEFGAQVVSATLDRMNSGANSNPRAYDHVNDSYHFNKSILGTFTV